MTRRGWPYTWALLIGLVITIAGISPVDAAPGGYRGYVTILTLTNDADGIRKIASIGGSGALTLDGDLVSSGVATVTATPLTKVAQKVSVLSAGNDAGINLTIVGNDADGKDETEVLTLTSGGTVHSARWYYDVESITASGASAGNVTIGFLAAQGGVSDIITPRLIGYSHDTGLSLEINGTMTVTVEATLSNVPSVNEPTWYGTLDMTGVTTDVNGNFNVAVGGVRIKITAYTSGNTELITLQGRIQ